MAGWRTVATVLVLAAAGCGDDGLSEGDEVLDVWRFTDD